MQNFTQNPSKNNMLNTPSTEPCRGAISPPKADRQISTLTNYQIKPISKLRHFQINLISKLAEFPNYHINSISKLTILQIMNNTSTLNLKKTVYSTVSSKLLLLSLVFLTGWNMMWGQTTVTFSTTNTTWNVPANVSSMTIECWGGGGGGGKAWRGGSAGNATGGGGGGGAYSKVTVTSGWAASLNVTIGNGGAGYTGTTNDTRGATGGTTSVTGTSLLCSAIGGTGGVSKNSSNGAGGAGGNSGTGYLWAGGTGSNGVTSTRNWGGAGGGAGGETAVGSNGGDSYTNSNTGSPKQGGAGGSGAISGKGGNGGRFSTVPLAPTAGANYGAGGGGGAVYTANTSQNGANGSDGYVRITYTVCNSVTISLTSGSSPQTICPGGSITNMVYTYSGEATGASVTGLPAGLSSSVNAGAKTVTISGTPTASGTFTITTTSHTCGSAATINGTVNSGFALPGSPAASAWGSGSGNGTGCAGTGPGISAANPFVPTTTHYNLCAAYPGDWIFISVTAGDSYEFLTNSASDVVTSFVYLTNQAGTSVYTSAEGILTWKATSTEIIRFYVQDAGCARVNSDRRRWVKKISSSSNEINYGGPWGPSDASPTTSAVSYIYGTEYRHVSAGDICGSSSGAIRFQKVGSWLEAAFDYVPCEVSFCYAYNTDVNNTLKLEQSANGTAWTNVATPIAQATTSSTGENRTYSLLSTTRYLRWTQTAYISGNNRIDDILVKKAPTAPAIGTITQPTCATATASVALSGLPASGSWTVTGSPSGSLSGSGTMGTVSGLTANTTYTFTVTNASGCTSVASANAVVNAQPATPSAPTSVTPSATTICHGNSVNLNATSADNTINWYTVASDGSAIQTGVSSAADHSVSPTANTTYYAEAQNGSGCKSSRVATDLVTVENPVSAINTAIGTTLQTNDYVWVGQTDAVWATVNNWRQFDGTNLIAAGSAPGSNNTNRIYVVQNSTSSNCIFNASNLSVGSTLGVTSFLVGTGTSLNLNGQNLNLTGNITINGTFTPGSGTITLSGSANQTLDGASALSFSNVTINKTGGTLTAKKDMTITGTLTLTNGILYMNSKTLTMGTVSANGTITGGSVSSYIVALNGTTPSKLIHRVNSTTNETYRFPIGTGSVYSPVTVVMKGGTLSNASIQVWTKNSKVTGLNPNLLKTLNRSWYVEQTGIASPSYDISYIYGTDELSGDNNELLVPLKVSSGIWYAPTSSLLTNCTKIGSYSVDYPTRTLTWTGLNSFSEFGGGGGENQPLPVELLSFAGSCENGIVNLYWQTASEFNSLHFDVEKSRDGESWQVIETIPSAGNSNELLNYTAYDQVTNILNYYRLNQVDIDGTNKRYDPIAVSCEDLQNGILMTYPNPSNEGFNILINDKDLVGEMNMNINTSTGSRMLQKRIVVKEGINVFMMNEKLLPGLYFIEVKDQHNKTKLIKHLVN
jgi:hypothetical protein